MIFLRRVSRPASPVKPATATIPIIFAIGGDPIKMGVIASLNRPGGNITGVAFLVATLVAKQVEILHEAVSKTALIGYLINSTVANLEKRHERYAGSGRIG